MQLKNLNTLPTPCYVVCEDLLIKNLEKLRSVIDATGCNILLAQKGFSMYRTYPLIAKYLQGTTASSLFEAKLGYEEFGGQVHIFTPCYKEAEFDQIASMCDHIVFNSFNELAKYSKRLKENYPKVSYGLRINPEYSEIETDIYNPCFKHSRLGVTLANFKEDEFDGVEGLHFHAMCEQNSDTLKRIIGVVDNKFSHILSKVKWVNFGGGHHITREDYDIPTLIECINFIKQKYNVQVYLEPGEAVALNTGFLVSRVMDIISNGMEIAILDTSASCHMPDVLEMPYRPNIIGADMPNVKKYTYKLGTPTCLAGDIIGDYSFDEQLKIGDYLVFCDMAHYSMVKNNTFNGINLPSIVYFAKDKYEIVKSFGYEDFKRRL